MKRFLLFSLLSVFCFTISAQTKTWIGPVGGSFNVASNWTPSGIPSNVNDVIIPSGSNLIIDGANVKSFTTQGTVVGSMTNNIVFTNPSVFSANTTINWSSGNFEGNSTMTNQGILNLVGATGKALFGTTGLINQNTINFNGTGNLLLGFGSPTLTNATSGVININSGTSITFGQGSGTLINSGLLRKQQDSGMFSIDVPFFNNNGTLSIESGTLRINNASSVFTNGTYNVTTANTLEWTSTINLAGTLTGLLEGQTLWNGNVGVAIGTDVVLNFTGPTGINWATGNVQGNGTLTNMGIINLVGPNGKSISGTTNLINENSINFDGTGSLLLGFGSPTLTNTTSGTLNINAGTSLTFSQGVGTLSNSGLIRKQQDSGLFSIDVPILNNDGTLSVESGTLRINNASSVLTDGTYNVTTGNTLEWASTLNLAGTLTGLLAGPINWNGNVGVAVGTEAVFNFSGPTGVNWTSGNLQGDGTMTNLGIINLVGPNGKSISGTTDLINENSINFNGTGSLVLGFGSPRLTNTTSGTLNINAGTSLTFSQGVGTLFNSGLIRKQQDSGLFSIDVPILNNDGTLTIESGTLRINNASSIITDGAYNVTTGNTLEWASTLNLAGTLTGILDGQINWTGNVVVGSGTEAILNFSGSTGVNWTSGGLGGNGTLTNIGIFNIVSATGKSISGTTDFNNEATINYNGTGSLVLGFGTPTFTNAATGVINLNSDASISFSQGVGSLINTGLIEKDQSTGTFSIAANTNNMSPGRIIIENGLLVFGTYVGNGLIGGNASVQMQSNPIFDGTIAPGSSPGILTYVGNYNSTSNAVLAIELNGPNSGTQYDVFAIQGNAALNGIVEITMGYDANINDEFVAATTTGAISQCNLAPTTSGDFDGMTYTFDVFCRNNNQVVLKVTNVTLGIDESEISDASVVVFPNPTNNYVTLKNKSNINLTSATLMDISGRILMIIDLEGMNTDVQISMEAYAIGTYFLKIEAPNASIVKQVIKK